MSQIQLVIYRVHNELIKDPRFVLVGRGTYGLSEWGYVPGTVKEVITQILRENGNAMQKEEIVEQALSQRQVKESTILLNLQDKSQFSRDMSGKYYIV
jgi:DNA-directed RNA polymerase delta subunit